MSLSIVCWVKKCEFHWQVLQIVKAVYLDCDRDAILVRVDQIGGAACHTGYRSCFYRKIENDAVRTVGEPVFDPKEVYK